MGRHAARATFLHRTGFAVAGLVVTVLVLVVVASVVARGFTAEADPAASVQAAVEQATDPSAAAAGASVATAAEDDARPASVSRSLPTSEPRSTAVGALPKMVVKPGRFFRVKPVPVTIASTFRIATLNVLGSQHTTGPDGFGPGSVRAAREAALISSRGLEVVGLQEVQTDQLRVFVNNLPGYTVWPQQTLGRNSYRLQLAFRTDRFELVEGHSVTYLFDGKHIPMPYALLRDRDSGAEFWVVVTHNSPGGMQREREISTAIEGRLMAQLVDPHRPVFLMGDLNEHTAVVCRLGRSTPVVTANGASASGAGCSGPSTPVRIDWIVSTSGTDFSGYVQDAAPRLSDMSDHYLIAATATISYTTLGFPAS